MGSGLPFMVCFWFLGVGYRFCLKRSGLFWVGYRLVLGLGFGFWLLFRLRGLG